MEKSRTKVIGVTGGKGGTGKSTVATALAVRLASSGRVLLVDADVGCPDDHLLLGIERKELRKVGQRIPRWDLALCEQCGLCGSVCRENAIMAVKKKDPVFIESQCNGCGACVLKCPREAISWSEKVIGAVHEGTSGSLTLLSGDLKSGEPIAEIVVSALGDLIDERLGQYEHVIVDTAAGLHCDVIAALKKCDFALAVSEPTPLGIHDLELTIRLFGKMELPAGIVLNKADIGGRATVEELAAGTGTPVLAEMPYSKAVVRQYSRGIPVRHKSINRLADYIISKGWSV